MRCIIYWTNGPFSGSTDIGVSSEEDPRVQAQIYALVVEGKEIRRVTFW